MAVYKKTYKGYEGGLTPAWSRFLVLTRYSLEELRARRFLAIFYVISFFWPLASALIMYLHHNLSALELLGIKPSQVLAIDTRFFMGFLGFQSMLAFFLAAFIGPGLISPDLSNRALPLYLARPFSRAEYVAGKMTVLALLMSLMTWVPGLLLVALQSYLEGFGWARENWRIAWALFAGSWVWILVLAFLSLALSAWVKWKPFAAALMFGVFFVAAGFGAAINGTMRTRWGNLLNVGHLVGSVWGSLFGGEGGAVFFGVERGEELPIWMCWAVLAAMCAVCVRLLDVKIRGVEVVR